MLRLHHLASAFCPNGLLAGLHTNGCFSEYFCGLAKDCAHVPESMSWDVAAPMTCAGITIFNAIRKAGVKEGGVLAIGAGRAGPHRRAGRQGNGMSLGAE